MKRAPIFLAVVVVASQFAPPAAADAKSGRTCPQILAGYGALDQKVILEFTGSPDFSFRLLLGGGGVLDGFVYPGENDGEVEAVVLNNCPEGDATGAEMAACTIWQGPIGAVAADGGLEPLPAADQPAAGFLHLEGFSEALTGSEPYLQSGLPAGTFEKLTLLACQE
jgi:hypothetical protein